MKWPAQSADLNPIEHLWHHIKRKLGDYEEPPSGIHELWDRGETEWEKIEPRVGQNLIESMPRREEAFFKAKVGYTKYYLCIICIQNMFAMNLRDSSCDTRDSR